MAISVTKQGPYFTSGQIQMSSMRNFFKLSSSGSVATSELRRNVNLNDANPIVPDATENASISSGTNLRFSQFRNSIKYYFMTQTGTNNNGSQLSIAPGIDITSQNWNANLNKNIRKFLYLQGTIGSFNTQPALRLDSQIYNLDIQVSGGIYGGGGDPNSGSAGDAMFVRSTGGNVNIILDTSANVYGGGGAGARGANGDNGATGSCINYSYAIYQRCRFCPSCPPGGTQLYCYNRMGRCSTFYQRRQIQCRFNNFYSVAGGAGGTGGTGGFGRGYLQSRTDAPEIGQAGGPTLGIVGSCSGYDATNVTPGTGQNGEVGGDGADWGQNGGGTRFATGGNGGRAIRGSRYTLSGIINLSTIKGAY